MITLANMLFVSSFLPRKLERFDIESASYQKLQGWKIRNPTINANESIRFERILSRGFRGGLVASIVLLIEWIIRKTMLIAAKKLKLNISYPEKLC